MEISKVFNMIVLGGYMKVRPVIMLENVIKGLEEVTSRAIS
jgi:hypothetical protein